MAPPVAADAPPSALRLSNLYEISVTVVLSWLLYDYKETVMCFMGLSFHLCLGAVLASTASINHFGSLFQFVATSICAVLTLTFGLAILSYALGWLIFMMEYWMKCFKAAHELSVWMLSKGWTISLYLIPAIISGYLWDRSYFDVYWGLLAVDFQAWETLNNGTMPGV